MDGRCMKKPTKCLVFCDPRFLFCVVYRSKTFFGEDNKTAKIRKTSKGAKKFWLIVENKNTIDE